MLRCFSFSNILFSTGGFKGFGSFTFVLCSTLQCLSRINSLRLPLPTATSVVSRTCPLPAGSPTWLWAVAESRALSSSKMGAPDGAVVLVMFVYTWGKPAFLHYNLSIPLRYSNS